MSNTTTNLPNDNTTQAPSNNPSAAYEASRVIKATPGILFGLNIYNSKGSAQFIQLHDATAVPTDAAVPVEVLTVPATSNLTISFGEHGKAFGLGIVVCNSSTGPTKTIGSADCWFSPRFK